MCGVCVCVCVCERERVPMRKHRRVLANRVEGGRRERQDGRSLSSSSCTLRLFLTVKMTSDPGSPELHGLHNDDVTGSNLSPCRQLIE